MKTAIIFCFLLAATYLEAQSTGSLRGVVTDQTGAVIPGSVVTATASNGQIKSVAAGNNGSYALTGLTPGTYSVEASAPGFAQAQRTAIAVESGEVTLNLSLHVQMEAQQVTVSDTSAPEVTTDPSQSASAQVLTSDALDSLSDDADDLITDLQALAGPSAGLNGAQLFIDGFTVGDGVLPNKDAIREIRINQNPFAPEFDTLGTGHVEVITKPGSDQWRGSVYYTYGNSALNSRNPYAAEKASFDLDDVGGGISGPINSRGSVSLNLDNRHIDNGEVISAVTLNPSTLVAGPDTQVAVSPLKRLYLGARFDYQLNSKNNLTVRYDPNFNSSTNAGIGNFTFPSQSYRTSSMEHPIQATETATIGTSTVNETRFQFRHQNVTQTPDSDAPSIIVSNSFSGGGASTGLHDYIHHHYEGQNYTTHTAGTHVWKFGGRVRAVQIYDTSEANFNGAYTFGGAYAPILDSNNQPVAPGVTCNAAAPSPGCTTISSIEQYRRTLLFTQLGDSPQMIRALGGGATQFSINAGNPFVFVGGADIGLFAGDDWKLKPNLTLSLGARYETQENIRDRRDLTPRVAFAWAPGPSTRATPATVIRGGFGIFYDRFSEQNTLAAQRFNGLNQVQYLLTDPDTFPAVPSITGLAASLPTIHTVSSSLRSPYLMQSSIGVERQLPAKTTLAVTYTNSHGMHELLTRDINAPLPGTYTGITGSGVFPYPDQGPIYEMESAGLYNQNQLVANVNSRVNAKISLIGTYTLAYARSNTDGLSTFPANQYDLADEYGPAANDVRNRFSLGGTVTTKWKLQWSPLIILQSGMPFNLITTQDIYGDTVLWARPGFATSSTPGAVFTSYGWLDPDPQPGEVLVPRNYGRGPGEEIINLRLARTFHFGPSAKTTPEGRYALTLSVSARNLLNHVNPGQIIGNINSPLFGLANQLAAGNGAYAEAANNRRFELQARFAF